ncbi:PIG-L family deacetylase [Streptomyces sp. NBC_01615]|uniref:PIG-L family deacetylase n=1 Tax=Streptomyces sp. NBC_01615 TaxID=2975898 RepID=UPI003864AF06
MTGTGSGHGLPDGVRRVLVVVAHPDEESLGLGGLPALLSDGGVPATVLCFTHGEASTLTAGPAICALSVRANSPVPHGNWASSAWNWPDIRTAAWATSRRTGSPRKSLA